MSAEPGLRSPVSSVGGRLGGVGIVEVGFCASVVSVVSVEPVVVDPRLVLVVEPAMVDVVEPDVVVDGRDVVVMIGRVVVVV